MCKCTIFTSNTVVNIPLDSQDDIKCSVQYEQLKCEIEFMPPREIVVYVYVYS